MGSCRLLVKVRPHSTDTTEEGVGNLKTVRKLRVALPVVVSLGTFGLLSAFAAIPAHAAGVSQITLSCSSPPPQSDDTNGCTSSNPIFASSTGTLDFIGGFWIWCQNPTQGTPYGPDCSGSAYIEEVNTSTGTGVYQNTPIRGGSSTGGTTGVQVSFTTSDGDMSCVLDVPASPTSGPSNTISGTCDGQSITFRNVVVGS
jgi:hypothetical protein